MLPNKTTNQLQYKLDPYAIMSTNYDVEYLVYGHDAFSSLKNNWTKKSLIDEQSMIFFYINLSLI